VPKKSNAIIIKKKSESDLIVNAIAINSRVIPPTEENAVKILKERYSAEIKNNAISPTKSSPLNLSSKLECLMNENQFFSSAFKRELSKF